MNVAVIPARKGSKRIKDKNRRHFCGWPIFVYSLRAAKESGLFDQIIVSSDDEWLLGQGDVYGFKALQRPPELCDDITPLAPVFAHAVGQAEYACMIFAAAPMLKANDLCGGFELLKESGADSVLSVIEAHPHPMRALTLKDGRLAKPGDFAMRTQDLPPMYHDAGQFVWVRMDRFNGELVTDHTVPYIMRGVVDIDTEEDWEKAELIYKAL